eukprot:COSAG05_NODE_74_length_21769_cov_194.316290_34_plen_38_part_00
MPDNVPYQPVEPCRGGGHPHRLLISLRSSRNASESAS